MKRLFLTRARSLIVLVVVSLLAAGALAGCGIAKVATGESSQPSVKASAPAQEFTEEQKDSIANIETRTPEEIEAAFVAVRDAEDANAGSVFKAVDVRVAGEWARVSVEESGVPEDEAVGFGVYLRKGGDGSWEVAQSGTGVSPDDLPGAPPEIFE